jgi:hypothetical protein
MSSFSANRGKSPEIRRSKKEVKNISGIFFRKGIPYQEFQEGFFPAV